MKEGWTYKKLGEVSSFQNGFAFKSNLFRKEGCPIVRISNIQNEEVQTDDIVYFNKEEYPVNFDNYKIFPNDILIAMSGGTTGKLGINTTNTIFYQNQRVGVIREDKKTLNHRFLFYFLHTKSEESLKIAAGAAQPNLSTAQIKDFIIPVPPLSEQQSIVDYLDSAFAKIDSMKANAEKALGEAKALFQASLKEMLEPKEWWEKKTLPEISENLDSIRKPVTKGKRIAGIYPYYGASGIVDYVDDYLFDEDLLCISEDGANLLMRTYPIAFPISGKVWVNNHAHVLRFKSIDTQKYVEYYFSGLNLDAYITGAAQPKLTQKALNNIIINLPPTLDDQQQIVETLDSLKSKVDRLQANCDKISRECDALKQAILRQVFE